MKRAIHRTDLSLRLLISLLAAAAVSGVASAQVPVDENGNPLPTVEQGAVSPAPGVTAGGGETLGSADLEELVGPIALYPDDLLAIVLPASTYPLEIVQAARFLDELEENSELEPDESWDDSVVALLNYPEVVRMMNEDIDWTWRLGDAVIAQQSDVIAAIEQFRDRAYAAGNLKSDDYQNVNVDDGVIEIVPVDEEIIYVPYYEPAEVVVYQPRPVYYYYPDPYPVYYYPYPVDYRFRTGLFWGVTTAFHIGWSNHYLHVYHPTYWGHPYYGRYYYDAYYYRRPSINVYNTWYVTNTYRTSQYRYRDGDYWRPRHRAGARPEDRRVRNYYYPPNSGSAGTARTATVSNRDLLPNRDNGRMRLDLRERDGNLGRVANSNTRTSGFGATSRGNARNGTAAATPRGNASERRSSTAAAGTARNRDTAGSSSGSRPAIQFRDRSGDRQAAGTAENRARSGATSRRNSGSSRSNRGSVDGIVSAPTRRSGGASDGTTSSRPGFSASSGDRRSNATTRSNRTGSNTVRQTAPSVRQGSPTVRPSSPGVSRPSPSVRQSSPTTRRSTPSSRPSPSIGSRPSSAPRASAPTTRSPAVRQTAPSSRPAPSSNSGSRASSRPAPSSNSGSRASGRPSPSASSGSRSSSRAPASSESRRGNSRPRNNDRG